MNQLREVVRRSVGLQRRPVAAELAPQLKLLRTWQTERLRQTHADLLVDPRFAPACRFFLSDIYAPRDFSQRDQDILQIYHSIQRALPVHIGQTLSLVVELNQLSNELDEALLAILVNELGMVDTISEKQYVVAYRRCDNYAARRGQIDMIIQVGEGVNQLVHTPLVGFTLRLARMPARLAGWEELQDFLERGYQAFAQMSDAKPFLRTLEEREKAILDNIFAGEPAPLAW